MINNTQCSKRNDFNDFFNCVDEEIMVNLRNNYLILNVEYLALDLAKKKMYDRNAFILPREKDIVINMLEYYLNHKYRNFFKKTEYLCNEKEKICICNINADDLRKIYDVNYIPNKKYISWFKL
jgi:hypothetical protein